MQCLFVSQKSRTFWLSKVYWDALN